MSPPVAGGEVDPDRHLLIITMGEPLGDVLPQAVDLHHDLRLIMNLVREIGDEEGFPILQQGGVGLHENRRLC